jgi:hypothetical protein
MKTLILLGLLIITGCTTAQIQQAQIDTGLFCKLADNTTVVALVDSIGVAVPVLGMTSDFVHLACALAGGVPVPVPTTLVPTLSVDTSKVTS